MNKIIKCLKNKKSTIVFLIALISIIISIYSLWVSINNKNIDQQELELKLCPSLRLEGETHIGWRLKNEGSGNAVNLMYANINLLVNEEDIYIVPVPMIKSFNEPSAIAPKEEKIIYLPKARDFNKLTDLYGGKIIMAVFVKYACENNLEVTRSKEYYRFSGFRFLRIPVDLKDSELVNIVNSYLIKIIFEGKPAKCIDKYHLDSISGLVSEDYQIKECHIDNIPPELIW